MAVKVDMWLSELAGLEVRGTAGLEWHEPNGLKRRAECRTGLIWFFRILCEVHA
jgi:hypothetical protein